MAAPDAAGRARSRRHSQLRVALGRITPLHRTWRPCGAACTAVPGTRPAPSPRRTSSRSRRDVYAPVMDDYYRPYHEAVPELAHYYLEDSWVLNIAVEPGGRVRLDLDLVLTESHPLYRGAPEGEQYDYRRAVLTFSGAKRTVWTHSLLRPSTDASGSNDWGHIDSLLTNGETYRLEGDWGDMEITGSPSLEVTL